MRLLLLVLFAAGCSSPPASPEPQRFVLPDSAIAVLEGVTIIEGGLSGLDIAPSGDLWAVADRGPNLEAEARVGR
ncbi:hypothetical protein, partial [Rubrivirga sp.]|uniref:hypothetical protein n=1 Tax=Rubrivirga sp. TaxID=1885344 RepID=UPI003C748CEF